MNSVSSVNVCPFPGLTGRESLVAGLAERLGISREDELSLWDEFARENLTPEEQDENEGFGYPFGWELGEAVRGIPRTPGKE
jgi:hypothetical protein